MVSEHHVFQRVVTKRIKGKVAWLVIKYTITRMKLVSRGNIYSLCQRKTLPRFYKADGIKCTRQYTDIRTDSEHVRIQNL